MLRVCLVEKFEWIITAHVQDLFLGLRNVFECAFDYVAVAHADSNSRFTTRTALRLDLAVSVCCHPMIHSLNFDAMFAFRQENKSYTRKRLFKDYKLEFERTNLLCILVLFIS